MATPVPMFLVPGVPPPKQQGVLPLPVVVQARDPEMDTLPCFYCSRKTTSLCQLGAVLTTKNINLICMRTVSESEPVFLRQNICQAQIVQLPASICCFIVF